MAQAQLGKDIVDIKKNEMFLSDTLKVKVHDGNNLAFVTVPANSRIKETPVVFTYAFWGKFVPFIEQVTSLLENKTEETIQIYKTKYVEVKSSIHFGWIVCLTTMTRRGDPIYALSCKFTESEWKEFCKYVTWISTKFAEFQTQKKEKEQLKEQGKRKATG